MLSKLGRYPGGVGDAALPGAEALWQAIISEPHTGVSVIDLSGVLLFCNEQAVDLYLDDDSSVGEADAAGRRLSDLFPPAFVDERLRIYRRVARTRKPTLLRSIWRGYQQLAWIHPFDQKSTPTEQVLVISRRAEGEVNAYRTVCEDIRCLDARVIGLGPLDVLTPRELVVMAMLGQGHSLKETAQQLHRSVSTIETQRDSICRKLRISDRAALVSLARRAGLRCDDAERQRI